MLTVGSPGTEGDGGGGEGGGVRCLGMMGSGTKEFRSRAMNTPIQVASSF